MTTDLERFNAQPKNVQEVLATANDLIEHGCHVNFKFTCAKCGARLAFEEEDTFHETGTCDKCGHETDTRTPEAKLNYLVKATSKEAAEYLWRKLTQRP